MVMQECGAWTDRQTLDAAIRIAHHDKRFQVSRFSETTFSQLASLMREKFPKCPCRLCAKN